MTQFVAIFAMPGKPGKLFGERPHVVGPFLTKEGAESWVTLQLLRNARLIGAFVVPLGDIVDLPVPEPRRNKHATSR